jgi:hypothetical protein
VSVVETKQQTGGKTMWKTTEYKIESVSVEEYRGVFKQVFFLDAVQVSEDGRKSTSNICSGTEEYCRETLLTIAGE